MSASKERFFQAIERVFKRWPALVMVVDNCFGGANSVEKAEWMIQVTGEYMCDFWPGTVNGRYSHLHPAGKVRPHGECCMFIYSIC